MPMNEMYHKLTHDLDKITMMRRIFIQRAATRDGICLGQSRVLEYIRRNPNCSQKDIADFMEVSPPSVAVMVKRMVRDELIQKISDANDLRQNRLTITPKGIEVSENCRNLFEQMDEQVYDGFSDEELELLASYLTRLANNLAKDEFKNSSNFSLMKIMQNMMNEKCENKSKEEF